jgi:Pentapeptide repeats (9 copies)
MSPEVTAAIIAACVSFLTLIGTLAAQYYGRRTASRDAEKSFAEQREQLNETLKAQGDQLDKTLAEQRTRTLNERFATAAEQMGSDQPAIRLAGVYAMAGLAGDWEENRQTCVDVLCAYLRIPYEPDPGQDALEPQRLAFQASREVRLTVIRVITAHLREDAAVSWQGLNFDFTGAVFDGAYFDDAKFSGGTVDFDRAKFCGGTIRFSDAEFSGGTVYFGDAEFSDGTIDFSGAQFTGGTVYFSRGKFSGGTVDFGDAEFSGGTVYFRRAKFSGGTIDFSGAQFTGSMVDFRDAQFSGATIDFSDASDWSYPPAFPWTDTPPSGVKLPGKKDQSQT